MSRYFFLTGLVVLLLVTSACTVTGTTPPVTSTPVSTPITSKSATVTPVPKPAPTESRVNILTRSCSLLNSRDLASFFPSHTEVVLPKPEISQVDHPVFSTGNAPGTETSCVYYAFHLPGSNEEIVLQVNTWVDVPSPSISGTTWMQDWENAKSSADQAVAGVGDDAFFKDGRMSLKKGDVYLTVEAMETDFNLGTPSTLKKQFTLEKQIALAMLGRLG